MPIEWTKPTGHPEITTGTAQAVEDDEVAPERGRVLAMEHRVQPSALTGARTEQHVGLVVEQCDFVGCVDVLDPDATIERHRDAALETEALVGGGEGRRVRRGHSVHDAEEVERGHADGRLVEVVVEDLEDLRAQERRRRSIERAQRADREPEVCDASGADEIREDNSLTGAEDAIGGALAAVGRRTALAPLPRRVLERDRPALVTQQQICRVERRHA